MAEFHKALSDETRLKILEMLTGNELCVCEIYEKLSMPQPTVSHHLKILKYAGLVNDRKDGKWVYYSLNFKRIAELHELNLSKIITPILKSEYTPVNSTCNSTCCEKK